MSRKRNERPSVGDRILVHDAWTDTDVKGVVDWLMSEQFAWMDEMGERFITRYDGNWRYDEKFLKCLR